MVLINFLFYAYVFCLPACRAGCVGACGGRKTASGPLGLEFQMVLNIYLGARN